MECNDRQVSRCNSFHRCCFEFRLIVAVVVAVVVAVMDELMDKILVVPLNIDHVPCEVLPLLIEITILGALVNATIASLVRHARAPQFRLYHSTFLRTLYTILERLYLYLVVHAVE